MAWRSKSPIEGNNTEALIFHIHTFLIGVYLDAIKLFEVLKPL